VRAETIEVRRAGTRFRTQTAGTDTRHSFSFGVHYDPENVAFGPLLVHNDERVQTGAGYPDHRHRDAEILTWVLEGSLVHEDSAGNRGLVFPGLAQRMSAGAGIVHAERNDAFRLDSSRPAAPVRFVQMWLRPDTPGGPPSYQQRELDQGDLDAGWLPVASGHHPDAAIGLDSAGSTLWVTRLGPGTSRLLPPGNRQHVYLAGGEVEVSSVGRLVGGDSLRLTGGHQLRLTGVRAAELLVWEMAG
jgi:quercetin 2,3-dioxygenase